ncbi:MAG: site-specific DNA-methyltransferase [Polyangiaceae bacterium]|nr:site-specific DNA-methyltransferase [Polyangiaceae bacterium]
MTRRAAASNQAQRLADFCRGNDTTALVVEGEALPLLRRIPAATVDCVMTSPPYWGHRAYAAGGLGQERAPKEYVDALVAHAIEIARVLKPTGSFWLNLGDSYRDKCLAGIPWRTALRLVDEVGFVLRNEVVWHKVKGGPDTARDKLRNVHEQLFHFVRQRRGYFYDADAVRSRPRTARVEQGAIVSATGVRGVRYRRQLELSTALSPSEKSRALAALASILEDVRAGRLADFRMIIRSQQRTTHSDSALVSGRARELARDGFYFLRYHPGGSKPGDVWDILPEDSQHRAAHFAPFPADLCRIPILATAPPGGLVLDPFCGTGTTLAVAATLGRRALGLELAPTYAGLARERIAAAIAHPPKR